MSKWLRSRRQRLRASTSPTAGVHAKRARETQGRTIACSPAPEKRLSVPSEPRSSWIRRTEKYRGNLRYDPRWRQRSTPAPPNGAGFATTMMRQMDPKRARHIVGQEEIYLV